MSITTEGPHKLYTRVVDNAGNESDWREDTIGIDKTVPTLSVDCGQASWRNTLATYAAPIAETPIGEVTTEHILEDLQPIWLAKPETASRVRGRIERVLDAAKASGETTEAATELLPSSNPTAHPSAN